eukprot:scaffold18494_cov90-Isochrysis_galbana.AAC.1
MAWGSGGVCVREGGLRGVKGADRRASRRSRTVIADPPLRLASHTRTVESHPQLISTPGSTGDQDTSSTEPTWPWYGSALTRQPPPAEPSHVWI